MSRKDKKVIGHVRALDAVRARRASQIPAAGEDVSAPLILDRNGRRTMALSGAFFVNGDGELDRRLGDGLESTPGSPVADRVKLAPGFKFDNEGRVAPAVSSSVKVSGKVLIATPDASQVTSSEGETGIEGATVEAQLARLQVNKENSLDHDADIDAINVRIDALEAAPPGHVHDGADITSGTVAAARLGSGSGGATKFLREDSTWQTPSGGSGATATTVEVDIGSTPKFTGKFTITDAAISGTSKVLCWQAPGPYTGKGTRADEAELQPVSVIAVEPAAGSAVVKWQTPPLVVQSPELQNGLRNTVGATFDRLGNQRWPATSTAKRIGKVRGNVKFSYMVLA